MLKDGKNRVFSQKLLFYFFKLPNFAAQSPNKRKSFESQEATSRVLTVCSGAQHWKEHCTHDVKKETDNLKPSNGAIETGQS